MTDRVALVTGGGGGIGSAICRRLASDGLAVLVGYHSSADRAEQLAADLPGDGHRAVQVSVDDSGALDGLAASIAGTESRLDVLVNCAGVTRPVAHDDLDGLDDALIDQIFATNWRGPFATIRAMRSLLELSSDPVIVNISSVAGVTGQGSNVAYCASKAALDSMTRSLGRSLAPKMRVMSVSPGWVLGEYASRMPEEVIAVQRDATPLHRLATGDDVAAAVSAVVHDLPFTTGSIISVDGGRPLGVS
ncbi:MAG: SDR family oxidoreductase [Actinomycetota bacterium]